jgi:hypothetical protein
VLSVGWAGPAMGSTLLSMVLQRSGPGWAEHGQNMGWPGLAWPGHGLGCDGNWFAVG